MTEISPKARAMVKVGIIMTLTLLVLSALLVLFTRLTESMRVNKLRARVQQLIGDTWQVSQEIPIQSPLATSAVSFALCAPDATDVGSAYCAVVMRVETLYGPLPCVYVYDVPNSKASFAGVLSLNGTVAELLKSRRGGKTTVPIDYWARQIPTIISAANVHDASMEVKDADKR